MNAIDAQSRLSYLLVPEQAGIDADLATYQGHLADLIQDIRVLLHRPHEQRTHEVEARIAHLRMIQAHQFCEDETLPAEVRTFYAALAVERIAQDAEIAASGKGAVAQLTRQMEEVKSREGLAPDENWLSNEGPQDYRRLAEQREKLLRSIEQTIVVFLLRRYHLDEQAELYETDRVTFEVQREVGRILMMEGGSPPTEEDLLNGYLGRTYGPGAIERVLSRLREIRSGE